MLEFTVTVPSISTLTVIPLNTPPPNCVNISYQKICYVFPSSERVTSMAGRQKEIIIHPRMYGIIERTRSMSILLNPPSVRQHSREDHGDREQ